MNRSTLCRALLCCVLPLLMACGSAKPTIQPAPYAPYDASALDAHYFHSPVGDIAGHYPFGWLLVSTESMPEFQDVLFLYTDRSRTNGLVLSEIPGTAELRRNAERDGLIAIAQAAFELKAHKPNGKVTLTAQPSLFTINNKLFASYEYASPDSTGMTQLQHRAVVFTTGVRFYELAMIELAANSLRPDDRRVENFRLLQSVIAGLEGAAEVRKLEMKPEEAAP